MCSRRVVIWVFTLLLVGNLTASASHIYGGELLYEHISGNTYKIVLTLYGDCSGQSFPGLPYARPTVSISNGNGFFQNINLEEDTLQRKEVSPVCPEDIENTTCKKPTATLPGITRFVYTNTYSLPPLATWLISFNGQMNNNTQAGRSVSITNIYPGTNNGTLLYLEAFLNNLNGHNSSPKYTSIPTPFFCLNKKQHYNQGAVDSNNDSLSFSLTPALLGNSSTYVSYRPGYNGAVPLSAQQGTFSYSSTSGQLGFVPDIVQSSLVVNKVDEYKNGVLVGSSMREMTFIVLNNCQNSPPTGIVDTSTITGGGVIDNVINVCVNTPQLEFEIPSIDIDSDDIEISVTNIPDGAIAQIINNNGKKPVINFSWNTQNVPVGVYNIFVNYKDNACPLFSSQTIAYSIRVVNPISITHDVIQPTNCLYKEHILIKLKDGILPRIVTIRNRSNDIIGSFIDSTGQITDSFKEGTYSIHAESPALECNTSYNFSVEDSGTYPIPPSYENLNPCLFDDVQPIIVTPKKGATLRWYTTEGVLLSSTPTYSTKEVTNYKWLVTQQVDSCESVAGEVAVNIHGYPEITALNVPGKLCMGDQIALAATGGVKYEWLPNPIVVYNGDSAFTRILKPTTYIVKGYDRYGCTNTDTVTYNEIEQCCLFSYPNAFTPNNDGTNDGWRPISYGNLINYRLSVFDRWGKRIYTSSQPEEYWDGSMNGKQSDIGTYYYFLQATCITGHVETTKGSFILLR